MKKPVKTVKPVPCPVCGKTHKSPIKTHECLGMHIKASDGPRRGSYDEITSYTTRVAIGRNTIYAGAIIDLFRRCLKPEYCDFDKKGRGSALNYDLYGYDPDQMVAVVQAREASRQYKDGYLNTRKTYILCGVNEVTGVPFRHPVSSSAVRGATRTGADGAGVVRAAQRWMWQVTEKQLAVSTRQGDILLVPERGEPKGVDKGTVVTVGNSHEVHATVIRLGENGRVYALNPLVQHTKGQHATIAIQGWASVRVAEDEPAWSFARRTGD